MNNRIALFLSVVLHPLLMPTYLLGALFVFAPEVAMVDIVSPSNRRNLLLFIAAMTFLMPSVSIYYLYRTGYIKSLQLHSLSERRMPYLLTTFFYGLGAYFFYQKLPEIGTNIAILLASIAVSILFTALISIWWQISAHGVGVGGVVGAFAAIMIKFGQTELIYVFLISIIIAGLIASARLQLNAHTPAQVNAGIALGMIVSILTVVVFL